MSTTGAAVETYRLTAANGRHIRMATRVVLDTGETISFMEKMTTRQALVQVAAELARRGQAR